MTRVAPGLVDPAAFDRPELQKLWQAARERLERNGRLLETGPVRLRGLEDNEVEAICGLLGQRKPSGDRMNVRLDVLDRRLQSSSVGMGLIATLEQISGPVRDRPTEREDERQATARLWQVASEHPVANDESIVAWLESLRARGRITRLGVDDPDVLITDVLDGLQWLLAHREAPSLSPLPLSALAAIRWGDAHALDSDTAMRALLTDAVQFLSGIEEERAAWPAFGIHLDLVNSSALTYMLPGMPGSLADAAAAAAEPLRITHRMLDRGFGLDTGGFGKVWLCENPAILSLAADRLGPSCPPLVCLEGMPSAVTGGLLRKLSDAGAGLYVHTDFDHGGIAIASHVMARYGATPWRMASGDYVEALTGPTTGLPQTIGATPWDPELSTVMNRHRRAVHEEAIFLALLDDLELG